MSSAIEVLKEIMVDDMNPPKYMSKEKQDVLKKALLALEKQERESNALCSITNEDLDNLNELERKAKVYDELKEWLEKEIQYFEMRIGDRDFPNALGFRNKLREVLERVGEQK